MKEIDRASSKSSKSYPSRLAASQPFRADGRSLLDYRSIALETGIAPLATGSARLNIGKNGGQESGSGTEVLAAVKLEVENVRDGEGVDGGRVVCSVSWFVNSLAPWYFDSLLSIAKTVPPQLTQISLQWRWMICRMT